MGQHQHSQEQRQEHRRRASYEQRRSEAERRHQTLFGQAMVALALAAAAVAAVLPGAAAVHGAEERTDTGAPPLDPCSGVVSRSSSEEGDGDVGRSAITLAQPFMPIIDQARRNALLDTPQAMDARCRAGLLWPLAGARRVVRPFDGPAQPWLAGHRGIDLPAAAGEGIRAPADGVISYEGTVAGKNVVSIRHGATISSFEPASTTLSVGATVTAGTVFAQVEATGSDHCDHACLHWGVRRGKDDYLDPVEEATPRKTVLKPLAAMDRGFVHVQSEVDSIQPTRENHEEGIHPAPGAAHRRR